jgi:Leucine-rich repeat (LRR) protein
MNRPVRACLIAGALLLAAVPAAFSASPFKDKQLEAAVQASLRLPKPDFKDDDLAKLSILDVTGKGIKDLTGLEKCKGLAELKLGKNEVTKLEPIKDLPILQSLFLNDNKISDVTPLGGLVKLQLLDLSNNQVADLKPLAKLTAMASLYLTNNKIKDIAPLEGLTKLASLNLDKNQVSDLKPLAKVNRLTTLVLSENQISDVSPLTSQTELMLLQLEKNKIADLAALVKWAKADADGAKRFAPYLRLYLAGNPLSAEAKTKQLPALKAAGVRLLDVDEKKKDK